MMSAEITGGFWADRIDMNAESALPHQWGQLEASGCIENFRIAAGESEAFRTGWFFADSDAYKWLEAVVRSLALRPDGRLQETADTFTELIGRVQEDDGYIYTYNQIHFPGARWENPRIEHELYCHGHLIEAGVSDYERRGETPLFAVARRAADRVVEDFLSGGTEETPGHQEIEIAFLRLYRVTGEKRYLDTARRFLEDRGKDPLFALKVIGENGRVGKREKAVRRQEDEFLRAHPDYTPFKLPPDNETAKPPGSAVRFFTEALSGRYFQQHRPLRRLTEPAGHAVRFVYQQTAAAMLAKETGDDSLAAASQRAWDRMVSRHMYITGGLGSVPGTEGFGRPGMLPNETAYAETCASLGALYWSRELAGFTGEAKYADLIEWQLYNGSSVGMGLEGTEYFYNNPLSSRGKMRRQAWYRVPCCPSNISRTWADLGRYVCTEYQDGFRVDQYIIGRFSGDRGTVKVQSGLPWTGHVSIHVAPAAGAGEFALSLRIPAWSADTRVLVNGEEVSVPAPLSPPETAAGGYDPRPARRADLRRAWQAGDRVELTFDMTVRRRTAAPSVRDCRGRVALTRGPLVYCLEDIDNPGMDVFEAGLGGDTPEAVFQPELLGGTEVLTKGELTFIPYFLWGNRGPSKMNVWVRS